jgi:hypothetical protein
MRVLWLAAFALSACQPQAANTQNEAVPDENTAVAPPAENTQNLVWVVEPVGRPETEEERRAIDQLTPAQRRAYMKGFEDCLAGRYAPDPWPEAYRLGCAAANDR